MTDQAHIPTHIGFILDGNRRWAKAQGLPKLEGHRRGYDNLKSIAEACLDRGIKVVSAYIFSTENWQREESEVSYLMDLALKIFTRDLQEFDDKGFRIIISGVREKLSDKLLQAIDESMERTRNNTKGILNLCFNYGGQLEITEAVKKIVAAGTAADQITTDTIRDNLFAPELPPVDFIVRTSGEQRLSNFLLWDSAYAELCFVSTPWPAFSAAELDEVLADYQTRQRRFGGS